MMIFMIGACRSTSGEKEEVLNVSQSDEHDNNSAQERAIRRAMWKLFEKLPRAKLEVLAERYVHATDWLIDWEYHVQLDQYFIDMHDNDHSKFRRDYIAKYGHEYPTYLENPPFRPGGWEIVEKEPVRSMLKPLREDKELAPLLNTEEGRKLLSTQFLPVVVEYYICKHPERKDGWNLLWVFAQEEIEEAPYCSKIRELFRRFKLYRYPYGKIMWPEIKNTRGGIPATKL